MKWLKCALCSLIKWTLSDFQHISCVLRVHFKSQSGNTEICIYYCFPKAENARSLFKHLWLVLKNQTYLLFSSLSHSFYYWKKDTDVVLCTLLMTFEIFKQSWRIMLITKSELIKQWKIRMIYWRFGSQAHFYMKLYGWCSLLQHQFKWAGTFFNKKYRLIRWRLWR